MKVKFYLEKLWDDEVWACAESDLRCFGFDCIQSLLSAAESLTDAEELLSELKKNKTYWWVNEGRVEGHGEMLKLYAPGCATEHVVIRRDMLRKVVRDWIRFLETREPAEYEY